MFCPSVPVSRPVLTLNPAGTQPVVGDVLELRCEAQRGSPPILYWFYHDNATLGKILAPFGGGTSFNLSLTAQPSGNYSCAADNGLGIQCSEVVMLNFTGGLAVPGLQVTVMSIKYFSNRLYKFCQCQRVLQHDTKAWGFWRLVLISWRRRKGNKFSSQMLPITLYVSLF